MSKATRPVRIRLAFAENSPIVKAIKQVLPENPETHIYVDSDADVVVDMEIAEAPNSLARILNLIEEAREKMVSGP
jgi:capsule polysaccharide export protein KpsC/LpsZ